MQAPGSRVVRVFISSTFRDFQEERRLLVNEVFPELRRRARERFVEVIEVDLRWGITQAETERGETLPICLREIERSRPYFIGMLGERYGWVPERGSFAPAVLELQPWLEPHAGTRSVTEIEVLHGVLNESGMAGRALFYLRDPAYAAARGADFLPASVADGELLGALKRRVVASGSSVSLDYGDPAELARRVLDDLWRLIDAEFPESSVPDAWTRERRRHETAMFRHVRFGVGQQKVIAEIESIVAGANPDASAQRHRLAVLSGEPGSGKSAALAMWVSKHREHASADVVLWHAVGASANSHDPEALKARIKEWIRRETGVSELPREGPSVASVGSEPGLADWFALLSTRMMAENRRAIIVVDGLDGLDADPSLEWLPSHVPPCVHVIVTASGEAALEGCAARDRFEVAIPALAGEARRDFIRGYLARFDRRLDEPALEGILSHGLSGSPEFLRTLLDELRCQADHEGLSRCLARMLGCSSMRALQAMRLERIESLCGQDIAAAALTALWASDGAFAETDLLACTGLAPRAWASLRLQLDEAVLEREDGLLLQGSALRDAIATRYLKGDGSDAVDGERLRALHRRLASFWRDRELTETSVMARVHHSLMAEDEAELRSILMDPHSALVAIMSLSSERLGRIFRTLHDAGRFDVADWIQRGLDGWLASGSGHAARDILSRLLDHVSVTWHVGAHADALLERLEREADTPHHRALALLRRGEIEWARGKFVEAARIACEAAVVHDSAGNPPHVIAQALSLQAGALLAARQPAEAERSLVEAVRRLNESPAEHQVQLAQTLVSLGDARVDQGRFRDAFDDFMAAWACLNCAGWRSHLNLRDNLFHSLAILHKRTGHYERARDLAIFAAGSREERFGREHATVAMALHTAAGACFCTRQYSDAAKLSALAASIAERVCGTSHEFARELRTGARVCRSVQWLLPLGFCAYPVLLLVLAIAAARVLGWMACLVVVVTGIALLKPVGIQIGSWMLKLGLRLVSRRPLAHVPAVRRLDLPPIPGLDS